MRQVNNLTPPFGGIVEPITGEQFAGVFGPTMCDWLAGQSSCVTCVRMWNKRPACIAKSLAFSQLPGIPGLHSTTTLIEFTCPYSIQQVSYRDLYSPLSILNFCTSIFLVSLVILIYLFFLLCLGWFLCLELLVVVLFFPVELGEDYESEVACTPCCLKLSHRSTLWRLSFVLSSYGLFTHTCTTSSCFPLSSSHHLENLGRS